MNGHELWFQTKKEEKRTLGEDEVLDNIRKLIANCPTRKLAEIYNFCFETPAVYAGDQEYRIGL